MTISIKSVKKLTYSPGSLDSIYFIKEKIELLNSNEIEVQMHYAALNFKDLLIILGKLKIKDNYGIGLEGVGVISNVSKNNMDFQVGDRVFVFKPGCFQEYIKVLPCDLIKIPDDLDLIDAATMLVPYLTAIYAFEFLLKNVNKKRVLIHSACGGVGLAAAFLGKNLGAEIYATASKAEKQNYLKSIGIKYIYHSRTNEFVDRILFDTDNQGVDYVLNSLPSDRALENLNCLKKYGIYLDLSIWKNQIDTHFMEHLNCKSITYSPLHLCADMPHIQAIKNRFLERIESKSIKTLSHTIYDFKDAKHAFNLMLNANHIGRILLEIKKSSHNKKSDTSYKSNIEQALNHGFMSQEGCELFSESIHAGFSQIIFTKNPHFLVCTDDYNQKINDFSAVIEDEKLEDKNPHEYLMKKILNIWHLYFRHNNISYDDNFEELGGDSLSAVEVASMIKSELNINVSPYTLLDKQNIKALSAHLLSDYRNDFSIVTLKYSVSSKLNLILIHPGHGEISHYKKLAQLLDLKINIYAIENKIFNDLFHPFSSIEELAKRYTNKIFETLNHTDCIIGGWSYGGSLSIEVAKQLRKRRINIQEIWLVDAWGKYNPQLRKKEYFNLIYLNKNSLNLEFEYIKKWSELLWKRFQILLDYSPEYSPVNIVLFKAIELDLEYRDINDNKNHWRDIFPNNMVVYNIKGSHASLLDEKNIKSFAKIIENHCINQLMYSKTCSESFS